MSFNINNKLIFIDSFQLLNSLLGSLVKNLGKDDFMSLNIELDLVKLKGFYPHEYRLVLENVKKKKLPSKEKFKETITMGT